MRTPGHPTNLVPVDEETRIPRLIAFAAVSVAFVLVVAGCTDSAGDPVSPPLTEVPATSTTVAVPASVTTTTVPPETIDEFIDGFVGAYRTGNPVFLVQRVHPDLRDYYGRETCQAAFKDFVPDDTAKASIRSIAGPAAWTEIFDGTSFNYAGVYTLDIVFIDFGSARRQDMQIALIDDRYYFFHDCGDAAVTTTTMVEVELLDPDGDGLYFVHTAPADSEDFQVPSNFRVTYTGTDSTCAFQLLDPETGGELVYVTGLAGGGMKRVFLSDPLSTAYISDVLGCRGGALEVGPNP